MRYDKGHIDRVQKQAVKLVHSPKQVAHCFENAKQALREFAQRDLAVTLLQKMQRGHLVRKSLKV